MFKKKKPKLELKFMKLEQDPDPKFFFFGGGIHYTTTMFKT
jgi:hypothetical protein